MCFYVIKIVNISLSRSAWSSGPGSHFPVGVPTPAQYLYAYVLACGFIAAIHPTGVCLFDWFTSLPPRNFGVRFIFLVAVHWPLSVARLALIVMCLSLICVRVVGSSISVPLSSGGLGLFAVACNCFLR